MGRRSAELTTLAVKNLDAPGLHFVGGVSGLALQVLPSGGRSWILRATIGGRRRDMGLGGYPDVTLSQARDAARHARELIRQGIDPIEDARKRKSALLASALKALTFKEAAEQFITAQEGGWKNAKHRAQWKNTLQTYAYPFIGKLDVADVDVSHIHQILEPIWATKTETASRVRNRIELVLNWAITRGYRTDTNPARWRGHLNTMFPAPSKIAATKHRQALPPQEMFQFFKRLRAEEGLAPRALEFAILTAARPGEVRGAVWSEIDLAAGVWTVPASRMKAGREHRVPLSARARTLLETLPRLADSELVFPSARGRPLSDMAMTVVLRRMEVPAVPHGFRSTFKDWASEFTHHPSEVQEMALAHVVANRVEAAYRRGDLFEKRRQLVDDWARYCETDPQTSAKIIALRTS